jgi:hypothetical protein
MQYNDQNERNINIYSWAFASLFLKLETIVETWRYVTRAPSQNRSWKKVNELACAGHLWDLEWKKEWGTVKFHQLL